MSATLRSNAKRIEIHPRECIAVRKHRNTPPPLRVITSRREGGSDRQGQERVQTQGSIARGGIAYLELAGCAARNLAISRGR